MDCLHHCTATQVVRIFVTAQTYQPSPHSNLPLIPLSLTRHSHFTPRLTPKTIQLQPRVSTSFNDATTHFGRYRRTHERLDSIGTGHTLGCSSASPSRQNRPYVRFRDGKRGTSQGRMSSRSAFVTAVLQGRKADKEAPRSSRPLSGFFTPRRHGPIRN